MVADQDIIQVWLNSMRRASVEELLPEEWNACDLWCDVDGLRARIIHSSNFCQGPSDLYLESIAPPHGLEVVIVTYQSEDCLPAAIQSARAAGADLVTVVDNASRDATPEIARRLDARVVELETNLGFGTAANIGLLQAIYRDVIIMNPDVTIDRCVTTALQASLDANPGALAAPRQKTSERGILGFQSPMTRVHLLYAVLENSGRAWKAAMILLHALDQFLRDPGGEWLLGSCLAARRQDWYALHGFSTEYFLYMEDVDLCDRWVSSGRGLILVDEVITHDMGTGSRIDVGERVRALNEARIQYARNNFGGTASRILSWLAR